MEAVERKFNEMGAKVDMGRVATNQRNKDSEGFTIDVVQRDGEEMFDITLQPKNDSEFSVVQIDKAGRHLLLNVREQDGPFHINNKFLCGHDERHWFVAGIDIDVATIWEAKEALKPRGVRAGQDIAGVKKKDLQKRRNKGFIRQGEWFFVPAPSVEINRNLIIRKEPLQRGAGTPHMAEEVFRTGGIPVRINNQYPSGLSEIEYKEELKLHPEIKRLRWEHRTRNAGVYVRGKVRHPDHKTIVLKGWHRVMMSNEAMGGSNVFLD